MAARPSPTQVGTSSWTVANISNGLNSVAAIRADGGLFTWGYGINGRLGSGATASRSSPVQVGTSSWLSISAGGSHTVAVKLDNTLWSWGLNTRGQVGDSTTTNRSSPVQIGSGFSWQNITTGLNISAAIRGDNTLWVWGNNANGLLGLGPAYYATAWSSPVQVGSLSSWSKVSGFDGSMAVKTDGTLWAWGNNDRGQLGLSDTTNRSSPVQIGTGSWSQIAAGNNYSVAIKSDGTLYTWGVNTPYGQLGDGTTTNRSAPVQISGIVATDIPISWTSVSGSINNRASIRIHGRLFAWGDNTYGQLGQIDTIPRSNPVQIGISSWTQVSVTDYNMFAIRSDGKLFAWGNNNNGQLGTGDTINYSSPVQIGTSSWSMVVASGTGHTLALKSDGTLFAWGNNNGIYGDGTTVTRSSPIQVATNAGSSTSASFATTSSYILNAVNSTSASYALTASYALNAGIDTSIFATTGSNIFIGNQIVNGTVSASRINFGQHPTTLLPPQSNGSSDLLRLWDFYGTNPSGFNYAIGAEGGHIWFTMDVSNDTGGFKFYSQNNQVLKIGGAGTVFLNDQSALNFNNGQASLYTVGNKFYISDNSTNGMYIVPNYLPLTILGSLSVTGNITAVDATFSGRTTQNGTSNCKVTPVTDVMSPYTVVTPTDNTLLCETASGDITIILPGDATDGDMITVKDIDGSAGITNNLTVAGDTGVTIDGEADYPMTFPYAVLKVISYGGNWFII